MKIEKINDTQIRCTLTSADLERRHIRLSELAYGSEKAKLLFQDMMQEAHRSYGFDSGNSPLMIEAIPLSPESIVLIITKVDDPEELDTRFSKFSPTDEAAGASGMQSFSGADELIELFKKLRDKNGADDAHPGTQHAEPEPDPENAEDGLSLIRAFRFRDLASIARAGAALSGFYHGENILIKDHVNNCYDLILHQSDHTPEEFNKVCNILTEYSEGHTFSAAAEAYLLEHGDVILRSDALSQLCVTA